MFVLLFEPFKLVKQRTEVEKVGLNWYKSIYFLNLSILYINGSNYRNSNSGCGHYIKHNHPTLFKD